MEREEILIPWNKDRNKYIETVLFMIRALRKAPRLNSLIKKYKGEYKYMHYWTLHRSDALLSKFIFTNDSEPPRESGRHDVTTETIG